MLAHRLPDLLLRACSSSSFSALSLIGLTLPVPPQPPIDQQPSCSQALSSPVLGWINSGVCHQRQHAAFSTSASPSSDASARLASMPQPSTSTSSPATHAHATPAWTTGGRRPPRHRGASYVVTVDVSAFEPRYLKAASHVIQDLFMIDFAPKSVGTKARWNAKVHGSAYGVMMGATLRHVPVNWKPSRFTVVKSPFIDKTGMEQFEIRRYKSRLSATTNCPDEVRWLLEHLQLYEFTGVQLEVSVTGSTYLGPSAAQAVQGGVLAQHRADIAAYLAPGAAVAAAEAAAAPAARDAELRGALATLRGAVLGGLEARREALKAEDWYAAWHHAHKAAALSAPSPAPARGDADVAGSDSGDTDPSTAALLSDPGRRHASALLAALDVAMLSLRFDALERHRNFRFHFATLSPGGAPLPAAQWMHAVLKYGQYKARLEQYSQEAQLLLAYTSYTMFAHTLLHTLLKVWTQTAAAEAKPYLALPAAEEVARLKAAAGGPGGGGEGASGGERGQQRQGQRADAGRGEGAPRTPLFPGGRRG